MGDYTETIGKADVLVEGGCGRGAGKGAGRGGKGGCGGEGRGRWKPSGRGSSRHSGTSPTGLAELYDTFQYKNLK